MNSLRKVCIFIFWSAVGATFVEMVGCIHKIIYKYTLFTGLLITIIPIVLFFLLNLHEKKLLRRKIIISKYYAKSIVFICIGSIIRHMYYAYTDYSLWVTISSIVSAMLIVLIVCLMYIKKYTKTL